MEDRSISTSSIAKNLDEYQYIVCSEVRSLPDSNPFKKELQKYRIIIMTSFAKLIPILSSLGSDKDLQEWNRFAQVLIHRFQKRFIRQELIKKDMKNQTVKP